MCTSKMCALMNAWGTQSITRHRDRLEREAPAGALRLPTVTVLNLIGTLVSFFTRAKQMTCLHSK